MKMPAQTAYKDEPLHRMIRIFEEHRFATCSNHFRQPRGDIHTLYVLCSGSGAGAAPTRWSVAKRNGAALVGPDGAEAFFASVKLLSGAEFIRGYQEMSSLECMGTCDATRLRSLVAGGLTLQRNGCRGTSPTRLPRRLQQTPRPCEKAPPAERRPWSCCEGAESAEQEATGRSPREDEA